MKVSKWCTFFGKKVSNICDDCPPVKPICSLVIVHNDFLCSPKCEHDIHNWNCHKWTKYGDGCDKTAAAVHFRVALEQTTFKLKVKLFIKKNYNKQQKQFHNYSPTLLEIFDMHHVPLLYSHLMCSLLWQDFRQLEPFFALTSPENRGPRQTKLFSIKMCKNQHKLLNTLLDMKL